MFACLAAITASAAAEDAKTVAAATYSAIDHGFLNRNVKAIDAAMRPRLAPGFKAVVAGRDVTYSTLLDNFRGMFTALPTISGSITKIQSCNVNGAVAKMQVFSTLIAFGNGPDHKRHRFDLTNTSEDVWKKLSGKWKLESSTTIGETQKVDGKPVSFNPGPAPAARRSNS